VASHLMTSTATEAPTRSLGILRLGPFGGGDCVSGVNKQLPRVEIRRSRWRGTPAVGSRSQISRSLLALQAFEKPRSPAILLAPQLRLFAFNDPAFMLRRTNCRIGLRPRAAVHVRQGRLSRLQSRLGTQQERRMVAETAQKIIELESVPQRMTAMAQKDVATLNKVSSPTT